MRNGLWVLHWEKIFWGSDSLLLVQIFHQEVLLTPNITFKKIPPSKIFNKSVIFKARSLAERCACNLTMQRLSKILLEYWILWIFFLIWWINKSKSVLGHPDAESRLTSGSLVEVNWSGSKHEFSAQAKRKREWCGATGFSSDLWQKGNELRSPWYSCPSGKWRRMSRFHILPPFFMRKCWFVLLRKPNLKQAAYLLFLTEQRNYLIIAGNNLCTTWFLFFPYRM